jgi:hypothetical protein
MYWQKEPHLLEPCLSYNFEKTAIVLKSYGSNIIAWFLKNYYSVFGGGNFYINGRKNTLSMIMNFATDYYAIIIISLIVNSLNFVCGNEHFLANINQYSVKRNVAFIVYSWRLLSSTNCIVCRLYAQVLLILALWIHLLCQKKIRIINAEWNTVFRAHIAGRLNPDLDPEARANTPPPLFLLQM